MKKGKVQTVNDGTNVLVEHDDCDTRHISHLDKDVLCKKMSEEEINQEFDKIVLTTKDKISFLKKIEGFAISNVSNCNTVKGNGVIYSGDLFKYKLK